MLMLHKLLVILRTLWEGLRPLQLMLWSEPTERTRWAYSNTCKGFFDKIGDHTSIYNYIEQTVLLRDIRYLAAKLSKLTSTNLIDECREFLTGLSMPQRHVMVRALKSGGMEDWAVKPLTLGPRPPFFRPKLSLKLAHSKLPAWR